MAYKVYSLQDKRMRARACVCVRACAPVAKYAFYNERYLFNLRIDNIFFLFRYPCTGAEDLKLTDFLARLCSQICIMNVNSICNVNILTSYDYFQFHLL
jgi:hypothetical protein